jgi:hypothetical protein
MQRNPSRRDSQNPRTRKYLVLTWISSAAFNERPTLLISTRRIIVSLRGTHFRSKGLFCRVELVVVYDIRFC